MSEDKTKLYFQKKEGPKIWTAIWLRVIILLYLYQQNMNTKHYLKVSEQTIEEIKKLRDISRDCFFLQNGNARYDIQLKHLKILIKVIKFINIFLIKSTLSNSLSLSCNDWYIWKNSIDIKFEFWCKFASTKINIILFIIYLCSQIIFQRYLYFLFLT